MQNTEFILYYHLIIVLLSTGTTGHPLLPLPVYEHKDTWITVLNAVLSLIVRNWEEPKHPSKGKRYALAMNGILQGS